MNKFSFYMMLLMGINLISLRVTGQSSFIEHRIEHGSSSGLRVLHSEDINNDGLEDLIYAEKDKLYWSINRGDRFSPSEQIRFDFTISTNFEISDVYLSDVNHDGYKDLFITIRSVSNPGGSGFTYLSLNSSINVFSITQFIGVSSGSNIVVEDFDGDGEVDIIGGNGVWKGQGGGNFTQVSPTLGSWVYETVDYDGDTDLDLIGYDPYDDGEDIFLYLNDGSMNFSQSTLRSIGATDHCKDIAIFDVDNDLDMDVAYLTDNLLEVRVNDASPSIIDLSPGITTAILGVVEAADMDNDGLNDVVLGSIQGYGMSVIKLNQGNGTFGAQFEVDPAFPVSTSKKLIQLSDYDQDGRIDICVYGHDQSNISIHHQIATLDFASKYERVISTHPETVASLLEVVETNPDGQVVIGSVASNGGVVDLVGTWYTDSNQTNYFTRNINIDSPVGGSMIQAEIDGDGYTDFILEWTWYRQIPGQKEFVEQVDLFNTLPGPTNHRIIGAYDANNDGDDELLVVRDSDAMLFIAENNNTSFTSLTQYTHFNAFVTFELATDIDGSGTEDVVIRLAGGDLYFLRGNGVGNFAPPVLLEAGAYAKDVVAGDFDEDGDVDLMYCQPNIFLGPGPKIKFIENTGLGFFAPAVTVYPDLSVGKMDVGDMNGNGHLDLVCYAQDSIQILYGNGDATFQPASVILDCKSEAITSGGVKVIDIDQDSDLDVVFSLIHYDRISWLENTSISNCSSPLITERDVPIPWNSITCDYDSLYFDGAFYNSPDQTLMDTLFSSHGCDSISVIHLVEPSATPCGTNPADYCFAAAEEVEICYGQTYTFRGQTYNTAGIYTDTVVSASICDSVYSLILTYTTPFTLLEENLCDGNGFLFDGSLITQPGTYRDTLVSNNGCDSIVRLELSVPYQRSETYSACQGTSLNLYGQSIAAGSVDVPISRPGVAQGGCDSVVFVTVNEITVQLGTETVTACSSYTWIDGNTYYVSNNTATHIIPAGAQNGCDSIVQLDLTIGDVIAPVPNQSSLPDIIGQCEVTSLPLPIANDNCDGSITGTPDVSGVITSSTTITWTYEDFSGNISTQTQNVIIQDTESPVPDNSTLQDVIAECSISSLTAPVATDACVGSVTGTHALSLPISNQGTTVVTWTYDDGNGNTSTQTQNIIITDNTAPVPDAASLNDENIQCGQTPVAPTASDNCSGSITGSPDVSFPLSNAGTTVVTWTYDDGNGNVSTQTQNIIVNDNTAPLPDIANLPDVNIECGDSPIPPTATDDCAGSVAGSPDISFPLNTLGTTPVTWTFDDGNGNTSFQTQNVIVNPLNNGVTTSLNGGQYEITADQSGYTYQWIENCGTTYDLINGETSQNFIPANNGVYAVIIENGQCVDTSDCIIIDDLSIDESQAGYSILIFPNPTNHLIHVQLTGNSQENEYVLMAADGRIVDKKKGMDAAEFSIDIQNESNGVYYLRITNAANTAVYKVVKN